MYQSPESLQAHSGNLSIPLFLLIALVVCIVGAISAPALAGIIVGFQQLQSENHENAIQHYQRGLGYLAENYPELAYSEFQVALKFDSDYIPAQQKLSEIQPKLANSKPSGSEDGNVIAVKLLDEAREFVAQKQWSDAITRLEQLKSLTTTYQPQLVNDLLFQALVESGKEAVAATQIELARERFDAALNLRKDDQVQRQRDLAVLYLDGQQAIGYDYVTAIQKFSALYQQDPNYDDVKKRLTDAYDQYGDRAAKESAWCLAAREYEGALGITNDAQIAQKRTTAMNRCKQAFLPTPTALPTITALTTVTPTLAAAETFVWRISTSTTQSCTGSGDIGGIARDTLGNPLVGFYVAYEGENINRITSRTDDSGRYRFSLGKDAALLHVFMLSGDGKTPAGLVANVQYPGGMNSGCHIVVDWQKVQ